MLLEWRALQVAFLATHVQGHLLLREAFTANSPGIFKFGEEHPRPRVLPRRRGPQRHALQFGQPQVRFFLLFF